MKQVSHGKNMYVNVAKDSIIRQKYNCITKLCVTVALMLLHVSFLNV